ncbi:MAG: ABC transporter permease [Anaerolineales bacterium]|nr:ABC transporter permease [Anaerolineales bacterium]
MPPNEKAPLGTLPKDVDVLHPLVWGARDALKFGLIIAISASILGTLYGAVAAFIGGRWGSLMMNIADTFLAVPAIAFLVLLQQLLATTITSLGGMYLNSATTGWQIYIVGPMTPIRWLLEHINPLMFTLIILSWMPFARLVYSNVMLLMQTQFIMAARMIGGSSFWIIRKHLIPNSFTPVLVLAARDVGGIVLLQATFTFINMGGESIWGEMLAQGRNWVIGPGGNMLTYWWVYLPPTLAIMIFGIAWNMLGDGLIDALDPEASVSDNKLFNVFKLKKTIKEPIPPFTSKQPLQNKLNSPSTDVGSRKPLVSTKVALNRPPESDPVLQVAHDALVKGDLEKALNAYSYLTAHERQLDMVILDLVQVVRLFASDANTWKILSDALTKSGNHEHTANSYERLLRVAHDALTERDLEKALDVYSFLIAHDRQANEVVRDMIEIARHFSEHKRVWKILGDALTQTGNHELAAKSYEHFKEMK